MFHLPTEKWGRRGRSGMKKLTTRQGRKPILQNTIVTLAAAMAATKKTMMTRRGKTAVVDTIAPNVLVEQEKQ